MMASRMTRTFDALRPFLKCFLQRNPIPNWRSGNGDFFRNPRRRRRGIGARYPSLGLHNCSIRASPSLLPALVFLYFYDLTATYSLRQDVANWALLFLRQSESSRSYCRPSVLRSHFASVFKEVKFKVIHPFRAHSTVESVTMPPSLAHLPCMAGWSWKDHDSFPSDFLRISFGVAKKEESRETIFSPRTDTNGARYLYAKWQTGRAGRGGCVDTCPFKGSLPSHISGLVA